MLLRLSVSNLAVVEKAQADFAPGLNVLTGETGAGKSILMGALELVLGARSGSGIVRDGATEARVEAIFVFSGGDGSREEAIAREVAAVLEEAGIEGGEDLIVRRTVGLHGGGKVWINDQAATVATLKKLARILVDIHGARANQNILEERFQRAALDSFAGIKTAEYIALWQAHENALSSLRELEDEAASEDERDMLRFQTAEIEEAQISEDDNDIASRHAAAAHALDIITAANEATDALGGDESASAMLSRARERFASIRRFLPQADEWSGEIDEIALRVDELSRSVADAITRLDGGEEDFERLDKRLTVVNRLLRKYHAADASALMEVLSAKRARLEALDGREGRLEELRAAEARARVAMERAGERLRAERSRAGERLAKAVTKELKGLGFAKAKFAVEVRAAEATRHGCDSLEYIFEPNPGEGARSLALVASSGEAARVMLALKTVLSEHDGTDLLVFDEIDANIGGETGRAVGERLRAVATRHQVIAITHLPQSAAFGERHLVASKTVSGGRTRTRIDAVDGEGRVAELARMLGGGKAAIDHARALVAGTEKQETS